MNCVSYYNNYHPIYVCIKVKELRDYRIHPSEKFFRLFKISKTHRTKKGLDSKLSPFKLFMGTQLNLCHFGLPWPKHYTPHLPEKNNPFEVCKLTIKS